MDHFALVAEEVADKEHDFCGKTPTMLLNMAQVSSFKAELGKLAGDYDIQLIGDFNQDNAMAAGLACLRLELAFKTSKKGLLRPLFQGVWKFLHKLKEPRFCGLCSQWR